MSRWRAGACLTLLIALCWLPRLAAAQVPPPRPDSIARRDSLARLDSMARAQDTTRQGRDTTQQGRDTTQQGRDTTQQGRDTTQQGRDTTASDSTRRRVIEFTPPDSVMNALLQRRGYSVTRYQGDTITVSTKDRLTIIRGTPSVVARDSAVLVGERIRYNDSTQIVVAQGDTLILRDPARGSDDVVGHDSLVYNVRTREGTIRRVTTSVESGERWIVHGGAGAFRGDTTGNGNSFFYAVDGWLTSCTETEPHYHFAAGEMKLISRNVMVARPAILYIADIPVFWLPFIFQDIRTGRRSGIIPPEFGVGEIVRNDPTYRRRIDNFGYYFALSDYVDAQVTMDWLSDARPGEGQPGWLKFNGRTRYRIRDRFLQGELGASHHYLRDGSTNQQYSWNHQQKFSQRTRLSANLNYVTNTTIQRNTTFNPYAAMQTISSQLNFNTARGPFSLSLGGTQRQYPGRDQVDRDFPSLNITSTPIRLGEWFTWTPALTVRSSQSLDIDQQGDFGFRYLARPGGGLDSVAVDRNTRNSEIAFDTPVEIAGFSWRNSFRLSDRLDDFPALRTVVDVNDTSRKEVRVYKRTYVTSLDWQTSFSLPSLSQGVWNLTPSVQIQKVDGGFGNFVRTERTGGRFVSQPLRPAFGLSIGPTLYRVFPGFGPLLGIRHMINPVISYSYTPRADVSDEFLAAVGRTRVGYLGANQQNIVSLSFNTTFEAKLRPSNDSIPLEQAEKIKLLSLNFTPLSWDFERAKVTGGTGLVNQTFGVTARSDLLPGFDIGVDWSLFQGDPISDTATFKPFRESIRGTLSLGAGSPLIRGLGRLLGMELGSGTTGAPGTTPPDLSPVGAAPPFMAGQPVAGSIGQMGSLSAPRGQGWQWNLTYSSRRSRPPRGSNVAVFDPRANCLQFEGDPFLFDTCMVQQAETTNPFGPGTGTTLGGTYFVSPAQSNAQSTLAFHITDKWGALWSTTYDFETARFASHIFTLTRELHDWNAVFGFMKAPTGNFTFTFNISLKAQPDLKFDYDQRSYERRYGEVRQP